ncbi:hypothetical protein O3M35_001620 [Rhynocoris fuscipes]|uniref:Uncharacterized protein n=1 Tax=Rhynocoris fuscipes TaxID=488301 RepID=A0AAW1CRY6_9HEMI
MAANTVRSCDLWLLEEKSSLCVLNTRCRIAIQNVKRTREHHWRISTYPLRCSPDLTSSSLRFPAKPDLNLQQR